MSHERVSTHVALLFVLVAIVIPALFVRVQPEKFRESGGGTSLLSPREITHHVASRNVVDNQPKTSAQQARKASVILNWSSLVVGQVALRGNEISGKCSFPKYSVMIPARRKHKRTLALEVGKKCELVVKDHKEILAAPSARPSLVLANSDSDLHQPARRSRVNWSGSTSNPQLTPLLTLLDRRNPKVRLKLVRGDYGYVQGEANFWTSGYGTELSVWNDMTFFYEPLTESSYVTSAGGLCIDYNSAWHDCDDPYSADDDPATYITKGIWEDSGMHAYLYVGLVGNYDGSAGCAFYPDTNVWNLWSDSEYNCGEFEP